MGKGREENDTTNLHFLILRDKSGHSGEGASEVSITLPDESGDQLGDSYGRLETGKYHTLAVNASMDTP